MSHLIKIGLDVASVNTGIAMFYNDELLSLGLISSQHKGSFSGDKMLEDAKYINNQIIRFISTLKPFKDEKEVFAQVVLEMSNHGNYRTGQVLSIYVGQYTEMIIRYLQLFIPNIKIKLKLANPREWQLRAFGQVLDRQKGKSQSIQRALKIIENSKYNEAFKGVEITDDIADAINIASLANVLRDNYFIGQERKQRLDIKTKNKIAIANLTTKINNLYDKLRDKELSRIQKIMNTKKWQENKTKIEAKSLFEIANKSEKERIENYKNELSKLESDIKIIDKFFILGKVE